MGFLTSAIVGSIFGASFDLGLMNDPNVIKSQFSFSSFLMLRMFLSASATSIASIYFLHLVDKKKHRDIDWSVLKNVSEFKRHLLGGFLLGSGMFLSGSCPGTVWSQLGSNQNLAALFVVLGCFQGCFLFAKLRDSGVIPAPKCDVKPDDEKKKKQRMPHFTPLAFLSMFVGVIIAIEKFFPWKSQIPNFVINTDQVDSQMIDPAFAGVAIGLSQIVSYIGNDCGLGSSSGWMYFSGKIADFLGLKSPTLNQCEKSKGGKNQAIAAVFISLGSLLIQQVYQTNLLRYSRTAAVTNLSLFESFVGGVLIIMGARIAGGCTAGHGLTGVANINPLSLVTVGGMFGGGITLNLLLNFITN